MTQNNEPAKLDIDTFVERVAAVERHLGRVAERLPAEPSDLEPESDASDAVILHLWQAVQIVIDLAVAECVARGYGTPASYASAFRTLGKNDVIDDDLAERLARAAGFRNLIVHAYAKLDIQRVHAIAKSGPADLRAFLATLKSKRT